MKKINDWSATDMNLKDNVKAMKVTEYDVSKEIVNTFGEIQPSTNNMYILLTKMGTGSKEFSIEWIGHQP